MCGFIRDTPLRGESVRTPRRRSVTVHRLGTADSTHAWADRRMAGQRKGVSIGVNNLMDRMKPPNHAGPMDGIRDRSDSAEINPGREHYRRGGCGSPRGHNRLVFISRASSASALRMMFPVSRPLRLSSWASSALVSGSFLAMFTRSFPPPPPQRGAPASRRSACPGCFLT